MHQKVQNYEIKKAQLIREINAQSSGHQKWSLAKSTSNLFRPQSTSKLDHHINIAHFNRVLEIDKENLIAVVEGMTTYEDLVKETLKHSCLPTVVPELKTITVGGAVAGCGIESSSFRYGLVHESVKEMDVLLSNGTVITCNAHNEHKDLFAAMPNTFGTFGYILKLFIHLRPAKKFVKIQHLHFDKPETFFHALSKYCEEKGFIDFIEGVIFEKDKMFLTLGTFVDEAPQVSNYQYKNIYYLSIKEKETDYLTAQDYIWRWDADWFWCSRVFCMQNPLMRLLFGKWMLHSASYTKIMHFFNRRPALKTFLERFGERKESIIQDISVPIENALPFLDFFHREIGIKPIWACPTKSLRNSFHFYFCPLEKDKLYVDFGFWDAIKSDKEPGFYNRKIEKFAKNIQGFKSLYSTSYYSEEEFWSLYDQKKYGALKRKYDPQSRLRNFYDKCTHKM